MITGVGRSVARKRPVCIARVAWRCRAPFPSTGRRGGRALPVRWRRRWTSDDSTILELHGRREGAWRDEEGEVDAVVQITSRKGSKPGEDIRSPLPRGFCGW